jgi:glutathione-regulated potassium-efflux system ancillary protein KefG
MTAPRVARKILVQFAHPVLERSQVNRPLLSAVRDLDGVTVNDLYEHYPTLSIDVEREQELMVSHDVVVFHHPFYWYSTPAILKQWQDWVLEHGWAYGDQGTRLRGKITLHVVTTGGPASAYSHGGYNRFTVRELLAPWEQTANLCGMRFLAPFVAHSALRTATARVDTHLVSYRRLVEALRDDRIDLDAAARAETINRDDGSIVALEGA